LNKKESVCKVYFNHFKFTNRF